MKTACGFIPGQRTLSGSLGVSFALTLFLAVAPAAQLPAADNAAPDPEKARKLLEAYQAEVDITNSLAAVMVWIPAGYRVGKTEVTQAQFQKVMGTNPSKFQGPTRPVETVSPTEATVFCQKLTESEQAAGTLPKTFAYGLPSEKEFDAYIAGTTLDTAFVSYIGDRLQTAPVASLPPNLLGLHDVRGNVWEWCQGSVARGASYQSHEDYLAPAFRFVGDPDTRIMDIGFRILLREVGR